MILFGPWRSSKQTPRKMIPRSLPARPMGTPHPRFLRELGEMKPGCAHINAHFFLFTLFKLGNPESEEYNAHQADEGTKTWRARVACPASQLGHGISGLEPRPLLFYSKEMRSPKGMSPCCQRGSTNKKVGSLPSRSMNMIRSSNCPGVDSSLGSTGSFYQPQSLQNTCLGLGILHSRSCHSRARCCSTLTQY